MSSFENLNSIMILLIPSFELSTKERKEHLNSIMILLILFMSQHVECIRNLI